MPLPQLERRVVPFMGPDADYLGPEINGGTYRMKFIMNGRVIWVDVDPPDRPHHPPLAALSSLRSRIDFSPPLPSCSGKQPLAATRVDGAKMNSSGEHRCAF